MRNQTLLEQRMGGRGNCLGSQNTAMTVSPSRSEKKNVNYCLIFVEGVGLYDSFQRHKL